MKTEHKMIKKDQTEKTEEEVKNIENNHFLACNSISMVKFGFLKAH